MNRYLRSPPFNKDWDLKNDKEFFLANLIFSGVEKEQTAKGEDKSQKRSSMRQDEIIKCYTDYLECGFDLDPVCLQHKVLFDIVYYLARRGKEGLHELRKDSFRIGTIPGGIEFLQLTYHERTKKNQGDEDNKFRDENIILAQPENPRRCPVNSFKLYLSKLSASCNLLFQRPNPRFGMNGKSSEIWYMPQAIGINRIGKFLSEVCKKAGIKTVYTNHCLRFTTASAMRRQGFSVPEIASVTKHKNQESLKYYLEVNTLDDKIKYSNALFNYTMQTKIDNKNENNKIEHEKVIKKENTKRGEGRMIEVEENNFESDCDTVIEDDEIEKEETNRNCKEDKEEEQKELEEEEENWNVDEMIRSCDDDRNDNNDEEISFNIKTGEKLKIENNENTRPKCKIKREQEIHIKNEKGASEGKELNDKEQMIKRTDIIKDHHNSPLKKEISPNSNGLFGGAQLSNCTININVSK